MAWASTRPSSTTVSLLRNLHTHTWRCGHAEGDAAEYAAVAAAAGCRLLGFSEHTVLPDSRWPEWRMAAGQLDGYCAAVGSVVGVHPGLDIALGMECDWLPEHAVWYQDELLGRRGCDYLIGAVHVLELPGGWTGAFTGVGRGQGLRCYTRLIEAACRSGLFAFIAHPDVFAADGREWDAEDAACARDIAAVAVATGTPLELNAYGLRKAPVAGRAGYPWPPFWAEVARQAVTVVVNSDAHRPQDVVHGDVELFQLRDGLGLREAALPKIAQLAERRRLGACRR